MVGLVSGSHLVNHAYLVVVAPLVVTLADEFGVGIGAVGLALGVQQAVVVALQLPFGHLADRVSRALVLGVSLVVGTLGTAMTALAPDYGWLLAAQAVVGVGVAAHHPAHYPLLAAVSDAGSRGRAYSVHGFGGAVGLAVPYAVVAGVTAAGGGWRTAVGLVAVGGGVYALLALALVRGVPSAVTRPPGATGVAEAVTPGGPSSASPSGVVSAVLGSTFDRLGRGLDRLRGTPGILALALLAFVTSAAAWCIRTYTPQLLGSYGLAPETATAATSGMLVVGACSILVGGELADRVGAGRVILGGYLGLVVLAAALASRVLPAALLVLALALSTTVSVSRPARSALADRLSARADLGKNFALITVGISLGGAVAPPAFGWLIDAASVELAFWVVACLGVGSLAVAGWLLSRPGQATATVAAAEGD